MAKKEEIFVGLDIGSHKITTVVGKNNDEDDVLEVIGTGISYTTGVKKGIISEIEETVSGISESVEIAERMAGIPIGHATVNINGSHIKSINSKGVVAVSRADQEITQEDAYRVEDAAQAVQISANKEILHIIPRIFSVDGQEGVKDPIGMTGVRLEGEVHLVAVSQPAIKNLKKSVSQAGIDIEDFIANPVANSKAVLEKKDREIGSVVIDIGANTTGIIVYEDESPYYTAVLPIGSAHITNDIAIGLRTSINIAEKVKVKYGAAISGGVTEKEKIDLTEIDMNEEGVVSRKHVAEIIEARLVEIFSMIQSELRKIKKDALPGGAIITGGGARIQDIDLVAKDVLKFPAKIGKPHSLKGVVDKVYDPSFSTAIGLMLYEYEESEKIGGTKKISITFDKIKKIFKTFLP